MGEAWLLVSRAFQAGGMPEPLATAEAALQRALCIETSYRMTSLVPLLLNKPLCAVITDARSWACMIANAIAFFVNLFFGVTSWLGFKSSLHLACRWADCLLTS